MSHVKRDWERDEAIRDAVIGIAVELGALDSCPQCGAVSGADEEMSGEVRAEALKQFHEEADGVREADGDQDIIDAVNSVMTGMDDECSCQPSLAEDNRDHDY